MALIIWMPLAFLAFRLVRNYLRLRHVPGPFIACFTDLWRSRAQNSPGFGDRMIELHNKYGYLVRVGPNCVSVSDPSAVPILYGNKPVWRKASSYSAATPVAGGNAIPSVITMTEENHTSVRRVIGRAVSTGELLDYEELINDTASQLVEIFNSQKTVDISLWFQCFATEVVQRVAFTDKLGFLDKGGDINGIMAAVMKRFDHWLAWAALPALEWVLMKSPLAKLKRKVDSPLANVSRQKLASRGRDATSWGDSPDLLQKLLAGQAKHNNLVSDVEVLGVVMSIISAGADTTASTFTAILVFLAQHPAVLATLRAELDDAAARGELSPQPTWKEVVKLPYLEAVIKETMRYWPPFAFGLERIVPEGGAVVSGVMIPAGTEIGAQVEAVQRDTDVYGADSDKFRPERWVEADEKQRSLMERSFLAFSSGKRVCLGIHIAYLELKKVVPLLVMRFNFALAQPNQSLIEGARVSGVKYPPPISMTFTERATYERVV